MFLTDALRRRPTVGSMLDALMLAITVVAFVAMAALVAWFDRIS